MEQKQSIHIFQKSGQVITYGPNNELTKDIFSEKVKDCTETFEFNLDIFDESILFFIHVKPEIIKLSEIVPLTYEISSQISTHIHAKISENRTNIPCRKGCSDCCNYLVPLSIPEVFHIKEQVFAMPENIKQEVYKSFLSSAKILLRNVPMNLTSIEMENLSKWYSDLNLSCPFLSDNACSIYDNRPIACREFLVTGSSKFCGPEYNFDFNKIDLPVSILECLGKLSAEFKQTDNEAMMLPISLFWAEENPEYDIKTWSSIEIVRRLTEIINETIKQSHSITLY